MTVSTVAVCCDDLGLMSEARRLCAAAGLEAEVTAAHDVARWWPGAVAVLLDTVAARRVVSQGVARRSRVALLSRLAEPEDWRVAVAIGAEQVAVLPTDERSLLEHGVLAGADRSGAGQVVACVGASGGAGASTVAAGVALAAARQGRSTLLVDADPAGGGLDLVFGLERTPGLRWPDIAGDAASGPPDTLPDDLLQPAPGLRLLSWDRPDEPRPEPPAGWSALIPTARAGHDLVVVDVSRTADLRELATADVVLLVVRAGVRPTVAAAQLTRRLLPVCRDLRVVARGTGRGALGRADLEAALRLPVALELPDDRRVASAAEDGQLARALGQLPFAAIAADLSAAWGQPE